MYWANHRLKSPAINQTRYVTVIAGWLHPSEGYNYATYQVMQNILGMCSSKCKPSIDAA